MLPLFKVFTSPTISSDIAPILQSGYIAQGPQVEIFEKKLQDYLGYPHVLTVNSATSGLTLAFRLLNLQQGEEVISTPLTCMASNLPILANSLRIKWADVDTNTCNIDLESIRSNITEKTKAILVVHWAGYPVDLDRLREIQIEAEKKYDHPIPIVEDCAHAFGATYKGKKIGTHGNICVFSFQAIKHLTTGDGGMITLPTEELYRRAKLLRWFGIDRDKRSGGGDLRMEPDVEEWGYKFHMNDISAAIGLSNIPFVDNNLSKLRNINNKYRNFIEKFSHTGDIELLESRNDRESACWIFTVKVSSKSSFIQFMNSRKITVSQVHKRNDGHTCMKEFVSSLPQLDSLEKQIICIPAGWWLTCQEQNHILKSIEEWVAERTLNFSLLDRDNLEEYLAILTQMNGFLYKDFDKFENSMKIYIGRNCNGKIVCAGKLLVEDKFGSPIVHLEDIVVDKDFRQQGYGTKLVKFLIQEAKKYSPYKIVLNCKDELVSFYQKAGFKISGTAMMIPL